MTYNKIILRKTCLLVTRRMRLIIISVVQNFGCRVFNETHQRTELFLATFELVSRDVCQLVGVALIGQLKVDLVGICPVAHLTVVTNTRYTLMLHRHSGSV